MSSWHYFTIIDSHFPLLLKSTRLMLICLSPVYFALTLCCLPSQLSLLNWWWCDYRCFCVLVGTIYRWSLIFLFYCVLFSVFCAFIFNQRKFSLFSFFLPFLKISLLCAVLLFDVLASTVWTISRFFLVITHMFMHSHTIIIHNLTAYLLPSFASHNYVVSMYITLNIFFSFML